VLVVDATVVAGEVPAVGPRVVLVPVVVEPVVAVVDDEVVVVSGAADESGGGCLVPTNLGTTPSVAEVPTCQKTLHGWAPLMSSTLLLGAVMSVEPAWKRKTALVSSWASRVSGPVIANESAL
jgi:hypothetical protein